MPYPLPAFTEFVVSKTEKGTPVRAVNTPTSVQPPATWCFQSRPLLSHGISQMGATMMRCRTSKSELPQSRRGLVGERYPRLPIPLDAPCVLSEKVELRSSVEWAQV